MIVELVIVELVIVELVIVELVIVELVIVELVIVELVIVELAAVQMSPQAPTYDSPISRGIPPMKRHCNDLPQCGVCGTRCVDRSQASQLARWSVGNAITQRLQQT